MESLITEFIRSVEGQLPEMPIMPSLYLGRISGKVTSELNQP